LKLFLDSNILFTAAHNPRGKAAFVIEAAGEETWAVVTCGFAAHEAARNLEIKFPGSLPRLKALLEMVVELPTVFEGRCPSGLSGKDRPILLSAIGGQCTQLLTGDLRHFGPFMNKPSVTGGVVIQTVGEFLAAP
jgi:hypothetical protein